MVRAQIVESGVVARSAWLGCSTPAGDIQFLYESNVNVSLEKQL
jgi:hypothetical protein